MKTLLKARLLVLYVGATATALVLLPVLMILMKHRGFHDGDL